MTIIIGIDPGKITGVTFGHYSDTEAFVAYEFYALDFHGLSEKVWDAEFPRDAEYVIERFVPQSGAEYTLKEDDLAGVEVIGVLKHELGPDANIIWQLRSDKAGIKDYDALLKKHGLWKTGSDLNWTDGRDVNDATIHVLEALRKRIHLPTLQKYFRGQ